MIENDIDEVIRHWWKMPIRHSKFIHRDKLTNKKPKAVNRQTIPKSTGRKLPTQLQLFNLLSKNHTNYTI